MADDQSSSPTLNHSELAKSPSPVPKVCKLAPTTSLIRLNDELYDLPTEEETISYDGPHIWVTHRDGLVEPLTEQPQEQPATNGPYSETLTRLQDGYLKAISTLEDRNECLHQELNTAQAYCAKAAQRAAYFEQQNGCLQLELGVARETPDARKANLVQLEITLAAKNTKLKEKNSQIIHLEQRYRKLEDELKAEKMKSMIGDESIRMEPATFQTEPRRMVPAVGQMNRDKRGIGADGGKKQKKRKLVEFVREGAYNRYGRYDRTLPEGAAVEVVRGGREDPWIID